MMTQALSAAQIEQLPYRPCAGIMLINAQGQVFVGQRLDRDTDSWQMPQGGIDEGEQPREAAFRELEEETGLRSEHVELIAQGATDIPYDLPVELVPNLWNGAYRGQTQSWFLFRFIGQESDVNIATEHQEFSKWKWLDTAELTGVIVPFKRDVYKAVLDQFKEHLPI